MSRFVLAAEVVHDPDAIWDYIAIENSSPLAAYRQIEALHEKFALLATQPLLGEAREDLGEGIRAFVVRPFVVLYRARVDHVEVIRVVHSARDIAGALRRQP